MADGKQKLMVAAFFVSPLYSVIYGIQSVFIISYSLEKCTEII